MLTPSFFADVLLKNTPFAVAKEKYVQWALGTGQYAKLGSQRKKVGIEPDWSVEALSRGAVFAGSHDARISSRDIDGRFLLHMMHRDSSKHEVLWQSMVELIDSQGMVRVRHATARSGPRGQYLAPRAGAPKVLQDLIASNGNDVEPAEVGDAKPIALEMDAADAVRYLIVDQKRTLPIVMVTPCNDETEQPLVSPSDLAKRLVGMCRVMVAQSRFAAQDMTRAFRGLGYSSQFGTSDGAVRVYMHGISVGDSPFRHRLWTRTRIESYGRSAVDMLSGEIALMVVREIIPTQFFQMIDEYELDETRRRVGRDLKAHDPGLRSDLEMLRRENESCLEGLGRLSDLVEKLRKEKREAEEEYYKVSEQADSYLQQRDLLQEEVQEMQGKLRAYESAYLSKSPKSHFEEEERSALRAVFGSSPSPEQCLRALELVFGERVVVLPSAYESAKAASKFKQGEKLWGLLVKFGGEYYELLQSGGSDSAATKLFGKCFAANESETTRKNSKAKRERTFEYLGEPIEMWRHLKIGTADSLTESIRMHFEWTHDGREGRLIVGHCGRHLYLKDH